MLQIPLKIVFAFFSLLFLMHNPSFQVYGGQTGRLNGVDSAFENLLAFTRHNSDTRLNNDLLHQILDFVISPKELGDSYSLGQRQGSPSDYYEFTINNSLKRILDLSFHPDVPSYLTAPSSVRLSQWIKTDLTNQGLPILSDIVDNLSEPFIIHGIEFMENSPDLNTGAYYSYDLDRAIILTRHLGNNVLVSVSVQKERSSVGKKGLILGPDDDWNYLYTGVKGCTITGLGWIDSYIYDSAAIIVYYETSDPLPKVKCAIFKWLRAGWANMNLVRDSHIRKGAERFAKTFREIIEPTTLDDLSILSEGLRRIKNLSLEELRNKNFTYFEGLKKRYQSRNRLCQKWFKDLFENDVFVKAMTRQEMEAVVNLEYLKHILGKPSIIF